MKEKVTKIWKRSFQPGYEFVHPASKAFLIRLELNPKAVPVLGTCIPGYGSLFQTLPPCFESGIHLCITEDKKSTKKEKQTFS
jgi:hypothetical protein